MQRVFYFDFVEFKRDVWISISDIVEFELEFGKHYHIEIRMECIDDFNKEVYLELLEALGLMETFAPYYEKGENLVLWQNYFCLREEHGLYKHDIYEIVRDLYDSMAILRYLECGDVLDVHFGGLYEDIVSIIIREAPSKSGCWVCGKEE